MADNRLAGSPRHAPCSTTASQGTATTISLLESIRSAEGCVSHISGPVPLYLTPHLYAAEVRRYRDKVVEVRVLRTSGHNYVMNVMTTPERQGGAGVAAEQTVRGGLDGTRTAAEQTTPERQTVPGKMAGRQSVAHETATQQHDEDGTAALQPDATTAHSNLPATHADRAAAEHPVRKNEEGG